MDVEVIMCIILGKMFSVHPHKNVWARKNPCHASNFFFMKLPYLYIYTIIHVSMRRMEERSKQGQTNNKAKQHSTPKGVTFPEKNELPRDMYTYIIPVLENYIMIQLEHVTALCIYT